MNQLRLLCDPLIPKSFFTRAKIHCRQPAGLFTDCLPIVYETTKNLLGNKKEKKIAEEKNESTSGAN
jgi:hypothetical protein